MTLWEIMRFGSMGLMTWFHLVPWFHGATVPFYYTCQMWDHTSWSKMWSLGFQACYLILNIYHFEMVPNLKIIVKGDWGLRRKVIRCGNISKRKIYFLAKIIICHFWYGPLSVNRNGVGKLLIMSKVRNMYYEECLSQLLEETK